MRTWSIINKNDDELAWSNSEGWVDATFGMGDVFTADDIHRGLSLPIDGKWVENPSDEQVTPTAKQLAAHAAWVAAQFEIWSLPQSSILDSMFHDAAKVAADSQGITHFFVWDDDLAVAFVDEGRALWSDDVSWHETSLRETVIVNP